MHMKIVTPYAEADLIEGCKQDNPKMQRALYNKYNRLMYGVCLRYAAGADDAKDIVQEGFIKVFKNIHSFQAKGSFEGWIRRIMIHTAIEHYRKRSRYFMVDIDEVYELELDADILGEMSCEEILDLVQQLPAGYRTVFNLYVMEGYTHQEISVALNISVGTSKSQLSRAKKLLQERIKFMNLPAKAQNGNN